MRDLMAACLFTMYYIPKHTFRGDNFSGESQMAPSPKALAGLGVAAALGLNSLRFQAPLAPGGPLCRAGAEGALDGLEIAFKGGQTGGLDLYVNALRGWASERAA